MEKNKIAIAEAVIIGGSAGSLAVLMELFKRMPDALWAPMIIVLHRKISYDSLLADLFSSRTSLMVTEAGDKDMLEPGHIYLAPADYHLLVEKDKTLSLDFSEKVNFSRPSIDVAFESAADAFGRSLIAVLLSGANADGVKGLQAVKKAGGITVVQQPNTAEVPYMPQQAIRHAPVDYVLNVAEMATLFQQLLPLR